MSSKIWSIVIVYFLYFLASMGLEININKSCWKRTYDRGLGLFPNSCDTNSELVGFVCLPQCQIGYTGGGHVCWEDCPAGFSDIGLLCLKSNTQSRGLGYALWSNDTCQQENPQGCELFGLVWYPKCQNGLAPAGCCTCAQPCPAGSLDWGISCSKKSYARGLGTPMQCPLGMENHVGLCYPPCNLGYKGIGSMCHQDCPMGYVDCGGHCAFETCLNGLPASNVNCTL